MRSRDITSTALGAALQRIEPDDPEHPAREQPSGQQQAHGPEAPSRSVPLPWQAPLKSPAKAGFLLGKGANSTGREQSSSRRQGIAADP